MSAVVEIPLFGRKAFILSLVDAAGAALDLTSKTATAYITTHTDDGLTSPLLTVDFGAGVSIVSPATAGQLLVDLDTLDTSGLSNQAVNGLRVVVEDAGSNVIHLFSGYLLPVITSTEAVLPTSTMSLSTIFANTRTLTGPQGGTGYLDGISTTGQTVGCTVEFLVLGVPQKWILEASTAATDVAGGLLRPLDYNAVTNAKVWRQIG